MKKIFLVILIFLFIPFVNALTISKDDVPESSYIIGKYMFTRDKTSNYNGTLTTRRIMLAAKTINSNYESDMIIYYKKPGGDWIEALTGESLDVPNEFDIEVINIDKTLDNSVLKSGISYYDSTISASTYIIGQYMFTRNKNDIYNGTLTTRRIMLASKTINGNYESDMIIYYKKPTGDWIEALTGESISLPSSFEITNIDLKEQIEDLNAPNCVFGDISVIDVGTNQVLTMTCTDYESGIMLNSLNSNAFSYDNTKLIISSISERTITNGIEYQISLSAHESGEFVFALNPNKIKDNAGNSSNTPVKTLYGGRTLKAILNSNNGTGDFEIRSCHIITETSCEVTLPSNLFTFNGWTFNGWSKSQNATTGLNLGEVITLENDVNYYALWNRTIDVIFDSNNCTTESKSSTVTLYNGATTASILVPEAPMRENWASLVVSDNASSTTLGAIMGTTMTINNIDLYASSVTRYYNCSKYATKTLTMNKNDGSGLITSRSCSLVVYNGNTDGSCEINLPGNPFERNGWRFKFWGDEPTSESGYLDSSTISIANDKTIYAIWETLEFIVRLEPLDLLDASPDKNVSVYIGDEKIEFLQIEKNGEIIATNQNPTISIDEVIGINTLDVILPNGDKVEATIEIITFD